MQHSLEMSPGCICLVRPQHATSKMEKGLLVLFLGHDLAIAPPTPGNFSAPHALAHL